MFGFILSLPSRAAVSMRVSGDPITYWANKDLPCLALSHVHRSLEALGLPSGVLI